jgi:hypothetical protein
MLLLEEIQRQFNKLVIYSAGATTGSVGVFKLFRNGVQLGGSASISDNTTLNSAGATSGS